MRQEGSYSLPKKHGLFYQLKSVKLLSFFISFAVIFLGFLGLGVRNKAHAATYYVDSSITDTNPASGTPDCTNYSTSTFTCSGGSNSAYKTIADVNAKSFSPDDQVLFRKGQTWREQLTVSSSGTSGHPITFGAFGSGAKPVISGADIVTGLVAEPAPSEQPGDLLSEGWESGTAGWTLTQTGGTVASSADVAYEGTHSLKVTGNGTDGRVNAAKAASGNAALGETMYFFFRVYVPSGTMRTTSWRAMRIRTNTTDKGFLQFTQNASGVPNTVSLNLNAVSVTPVNNVAISNFVLDAWNTIEVAVKVHATVGGGSVWINGTNVGSSYSYDTSGLAGINALLVGNDAFGTGPNSNMPFYFDTVKVSKSGIGAYQASTDPNRWSTTNLATAPTQVFVDRERGQQVSTVAEVTSYRKWHYDIGTNTLTVYGPSNGSQPAVEASVRDYGVNITQPYITLDNLDIAKGDHYSIGGGYSGTNIQNCIVREAFIENIGFSSSSLYEDNIIQDNVVYGAGACGILVNENNKNAIIRRNTVYDNSQLNQTIVGGDPQQEWSGGIKLWSGNVPDQGSGAIVEDG